MESKLLCILSKSMLCNELSQQIFQPAISTAAAWTASPTTGQMSSSSSLVTYSEKFVASTQTENLRKTTNSEPSATANSRVTTSSQSISTTGAGDTNTIRKCLSTFIISLTSSFSWVMLVAIINFPSFYWIKATALTLTLTHNWHYWATHLLILTSYFIVPQVPQVQRLEIPLKA